MMPRRLSATFGVSLKFQVQLKIFSLLSEMMAVIWKLAGLNSLLNHTTKVGFVYEIESIDPLV